MSTTIQIKRSSTASAIPVTGDIAVGELAVNLADKRLYTKQPDGTIIELSTSPTDLDAATLRIDGVEITASATELNSLDGFTGSTTELNILDGVTATTAELNFVDGVTSNIQTQLNGKATTAQGALADSAVQPDDDVSFGTVTADGLVVDGANTAIFNRLTSDGSIVQFRKDDATVGGIGSRVGQVSYIILDPRSASNGGVGLGTTDQAIVPCDYAGVNVDATKNLGGSANRFKDLYLSGGVYLGGTGSANKLDDYEEGTWSYNQWFVPTNLTISSTQNFEYTKVGRLITISGQASVSISSNSSEAAIYFELPFAAHSIQFSEVGSVVIISGTGADRFGVGTVFRSLTNTNTKVGVYLSANQINASGTATISFSFTYMTS